MQIHELPAGTPAAGMTFAGDTGAQTQKIDYDALADAILNKLTTKTFDIESESQTIIAALNALGDSAKQGVANNLVTTGAGYVLDARQGKALSDLHATNANAIAALNSSTPQAGYGAISSASTTETSVTVTFPRAYTYAPRVVVCLYNSSYNRRLHVSNITATGFTVTGALTSGTSTAAIEFEWVAVPV